MSAGLAGAHILGQQRLREIVARAIAAAWGALPGYDERDVGLFLERAVPLVLAGQRQSVALTEAFIARSVGRQPLGVNPDDLIGSNVRAGAPPEEVYRRPFVTVWTALGAGATWEQAVNQGLARATSAAATDVQLTMRQTLRAVGQADDRIVGYRRVPDGNACSFCQLVSGQTYHSDQLMPIHNHCGCGVEVVTDTRERHLFTGNPDLSVTRDGLTAEVRHHGELGPVLVNGDHHFTEL